MSNDQEKPIYHDPCALYLFIKGDHEPSDSLISLIMREVERATINQQLIFDRERAELGGSDEEAVAYLAYRGIRPARAVELHFRRGAESSTVNHIGFPLPASSKLRIHLALISETGELAEIRNSQPPQQAEGE